VLAEKVSAPTAIEVPFYLEERDSVCDLNIKQKES